ncbi:hypothetical protein RG959_00775 [Domibacillus sp. 8LH]|uniref:TcaA NTF2-like domain-containing protein n=1 Tax=Domibacillus sp. 8LH TaxID=3073900 RepID=UPI0031737B20
MKIEKYEIKKLILQTSGLAVYKAKKFDGVSCMIRLSGQMSQIERDRWYEAYEQYQLKVINFKHLPKIYTTAMLDDSRVYSVVEYEEGAALTKQMKLTNSQVEQLLLAVRHLHTKKIAHGNIKAQNIWIANTGRIILYGAGETSVNGMAAVQNDIQQILAVLKQHSSLGRQLIKTEIPKTIDDIYKLIHRGEQQKPGLIEKEEREVIPAPVYLKKKTNSKKTEPAKPEEEPRQERSHPSRQKRKKAIQKKGTVILLATGLLLGTGGAVTYFLKEDASAVSEEIQNQWDLTEGEKERVIEFITSYKEEYLLSLNSGQFNYIEAYLKQDEPIYEELSSYISSLAGKSVLFEGGQLIIMNVEKINEKQYAVYTDETVVFTDSYGEQTAYKKEKIYMLKNNDQDMLEIISIEALESQEEQINE